MSKATVTWSRTPKQMSQSMRRELSKVVRETAHAIEAQAKVEIQTGAKSGRIYPRANGKTHQASAPGEAPATDMGHLVNSIQATKGRNDLEAVVAVGADYASVLEYGGVHMAARPFLTPAVEEQAQPFVEKCEAAVKRAVGD